MPMKKGIQTIENSRKKIGRADLKEKKKETGCEQIISTTNENDIGFVR